MQVLMPPQRLQLVSTIPSTDLWEDLTPWTATVTSILTVRGTLILAEKLNNFRVRIGIQTALSDVEAPDNPLNPSDGSNIGTAYISAVGKNFFTFDANRVANGATNTKGYFRVGVLYSSTDATISRGDVILRVGYLL